MTKPLRRAIEIIAGIIAPRKKILEIGSKQEKNQRSLANLRGCFGETTYLGIDMRPGFGVDQVVNAERLPFATGSFDLVLCLEVLEHAKKPWVVASEIQRVLKNNGIAIISSQQNFPIHNHPSDYFRYTPYGMRSLFNKLKSNIVFGIGEEFDDLVSKNPEHVVFVGQRKGGRELKKIGKALREAESEISGHKPYRHRLETMINLAKRIAWEARYRLKVVIFR